MSLFTGENVAAAMSGSTSSSSDTSSAPATPASSSPTPAEAPPASVSAEPVTPSDAAPIMADVTPASVPEVSSEPTPQGPIPFDRHQAILAKARGETQELRTQIDALRPALAQMERIKTDPVSFASELLDELASDPTYAPQLRSKAARILGAARRVAPEIPVAQAPDATNDPMPEPDYINQTTGAAFYSADQQQKMFEWQARRLKAEFAQSVNPLLQDAEQRAQQTKQQEMWNTAWKSATEQREYWEQQPGFKEHKAEIVKAFAKTKDLGRAYAMIVAPRLSQLGREAALKDLKTKATASSVNPQTTSNSVGAPRKSTGSFTSPEGIAAIAETFTRARG